RLPGALWLARAAGRERQSAHHDQADTAHQNSVADGTAAPSGRFRRSCGVIDATPRSREGTWRPPLEGSRAASQAGGSAVTRRPNPNREQRSLPDSQKLSLAWLTALLWLRPRRSPAQT